MSNKELKSGVYLVTDGTNLYKIGRTNNIDQRLKTLNGTSSARKITLVAFLPTKNLQYETYLHKKYAKHRRRKEWFYFNRFMIHKVKRDFRQKKDSQLLTIFLLLFLLVLILTTPRKFFDLSEILQFFQN